MLKLENILIKIENIWIKIENMLIKIADEDIDGGFLLLTPKGAGSVNGSGEHTSYL